MNTDAELTRISLIAAKRDPVIGIRVNSRNSRQRLFWKSVFIRVHPWSRILRIPAHGRSTVGRHFHARFDAQVFGDALDNDAQVARSRVAVAVEHPVKSLFPKARLARQLLERDLSVKDGVPHVQAPGHLLEQMLTIRLHLDDCDETNGALRVLPGSHRLGRLAAERIQQLREHHPDHVCHLSAGDALLMRPLLLHAFDQL
jgi:ribosomal protein L13